MTDGSSESISAFPCLQLCPYMMMMSLLPLSGCEGEGGGHSVRDPMRCKKLGNVLQSLLGHMVTVLAFS